MKLQIMPIVDLPLDELRNYKPRLTRTSRFTQFWSENVNQAQEQPLNVQTKPISYFSNKVKVSKVTFEGFIDKSPIVGRFIKSTEHKDKDPTLVFFHGYGSSKGTVSDYLGWIMLGFSVFSIDMRGQSGESPDRAEYNYGNITGHMTKGILNESSYYYRYAYMDCYRAIEYVLTREDIDGRIGVVGHSQGGGISLAMASLHKKIAIVMSSVPFLCNFGRAVNVAETGPYLEILNYLKTHPDDEYRIMETLSYFDTMNLAPDIKPTTLISVGLVDTTCPPSTIFATYNHVGTVQKDLAIYPGMGHEELNIYIEKKMRWTANCFAL